MKLESNPVCDARTFLCRGFDPTSLGIKRLVDIMLRVFFGFLLITVTAPSDASAQASGVTDNLASGLNQGSAYYDAVSVGDVVGGKEGNTTGSNIGNTEFREIVEQSLAAYGMLSEGEGNFRLDVGLMELYPSFGPNATIPSIINYTLVEIATGKIVLDQEVIESYTDDTRRGLLGIGRPRAAVEAAVRENISAFLWSLQVCAEEQVILFGTSPHRACIAQHVPGFTDYEFDACTLNVFLTDISQQETAERILAPFFQNNRFNCPAESPTRLTFQETKYSYLDLQRWIEAVQQIIRGPSSMPDVRSVSFFRQKIRIFVEYDSTIAQVTDVTSELGIPEEALEIASREAELRLEPSIAPSVEMTGGREEIILPAFLWSNEKAGDLVLGQSTLQDVERMLPAWPGHGPSRPTGSLSPWVSDEMRQVFASIRYGYNPARTNIIVQFDRRRRLRFVQYLVGEGQVGSLNQSLEQLVQLEEVHRDENVIVRRGRMGECTIVEAVSTKQIPTSEYLLKGVVYLDTCGG